MRLIESIKVKNQQKLENNFDKSKYGKVIKNFKDTKKGERCFIIGNGPSLTADDLTKLYELRVPTFAANKVFKIFDQTKWRPTYYFCEDAIIANDIKSEIDGLECENIFIPIQLKWFKDIDVKKAKYFNMCYKYDMNENYGFFDDCSSKVSCNATVTVTAMQFAAFMGFTEIYLIGVDHNYAKIIDENGKIVVDESVKNYFVDNYDDGIKDELGHNLGVTTQSFLRIKNYLDEKNVKVFNATRGGKLEVFPRVDLDEFFKGEFDK